MTADEQQGAAAPSASFRYVDPCTAPVESPTVDAFETIVARFFEVQGFWTRVGVKVEITKPEKVALDNKSMPRPEIDVVAWKPGTNQLLIIECKSYLDSTGVRVEHLHGDPAYENDKFKLFNRAALRTLVVQALIRQLRAEGLLVSPDPTVQFVLIAGKIYSKHEEPVRAKCEAAGWRLITPTELADGVRRFAKRGYENDVITIVTKLLERNPPK